MLNNSVARLFFSADDLVHVGGKNPKQAWELSISDWRDFPREESAVEQTSDLDFTPKK